MNDLQRLAELDRKLAQLKSSLADRVEKLTQKAAAPLDALDEGIVPALKQGEVVLRDSLQRYPIATVSGAVAAGAAGVVLARRLRHDPRAAAYLSRYEPYVKVAGEALRSLGIAVAAGFVEGAIRVVEKSHRRSNASDSAVVTSIVVLSPDAPPVEMTSEMVGRPM